MSCTNMQGLTNWLFSSMDILGDLSRSSHPCFLTSASSVLCFDLSSLSKSRKFSANLASSANLLPSVPITAAHVTHIHLLIRIRLEHLVPGTSYGCNIMPKGTVSLEKKKTKKVTVFNFKVKQISVRQYKNKQMCFVWGHRGCEILFSWGKCCNCPRLQIVFKINRI